MTRFHNVTLELVRPGPPHNQLLSPLTPYMALCGDGSPITFHLDFEHNQLLNRIERLRYVTPSERGGAAVIPNRLREAEVQDLGVEMGKVFSRISSLNAELARARTGEADPTSEERSTFVHLRLILSGSELSILPFELAVAPQSFPGEGLGFSLQGSLPTVLTREIRRVRPLAVRWDSPREPRVLMICAEPQGWKVPMSQHLAALRRALGPWIRCPGSAHPSGSQQEESNAEDADPQTQRLGFVKERLRVVPNASIDSISQISAEHDFTHVHILAHGAHYSDAGERRFGVALCGRGRPWDLEVVDGKRLAEALRVERRDGVGRSEPLVVTLATCDSGHPGSVLVPGGSIAHDLHAAGIPWVFASQFPLTKPGSIRMTAFLYPRLLRGDDPRQVIHELRRQLHMKAESDHDWASVVAYASVQADFEQQVAAFFGEQTRRAIDVQMERADNLGKGPEAEKALERVRELLRQWEKRLPRGGSMAERSERTNCYGIEGSAYKRMGLIRARAGRHGAPREELTEAHSAYRKAMEQWATEEKGFYWTSAQYLALGAVLGTDTERDTFETCRKLAEVDLDSEDRSVRAWAHGTLAELDLLALWHDPDGKKPADRAKRLKAVKASVVGHCRQIVDLTGRESFHAKSTLRQFQRYVDRWQMPEEEWKHGDWVEIAQAAVEALDQNGANR